uniref:RING-type E3 ubiquitin transferase n=1 Tax=Aegilops tauschii TaxID=37682 RepID=M8BZ70_AEGTA
MDLLALASRQCRRCASAAEPEPALKTTVLSLIEEIEREIVPERERLEEILEEVGINDPASCSDEIESLEREIGDRASERWTAAMIALVGLLRYAKCVLFSATPRPSDSKADVDVEDDGESPAPPPDLRCPISLDLMRDPVVAASGQTYDRESIDRWFSSGKSTCPKTGQVLANLELVPNKSLKNLISKWCRENGVAMEVCEASKSEQAQAVAANKAALEVARMTASYLVKKLSVSFSPDAANRVVHEIRLLSKSGSDNRAFVGEAGAVPMLVPLLYSEDAGLQLNAVTALLNLSILEANKKRIMHADGAVEAVTPIMSSGTTWRARETAAAAVLSLASVHTYRRRLGRNPSVVEKLVHLVMGVAGVEWAIWELMGTGTDRARRKAASLGRICRRWAAASAADGERGAECPASSVVPPAMMAS